MPQLPFDRYCSEIIAQAGLLSAALAGADLTRPVPSCPGWSVGQLVRHLTGAHRDSETLVRTGQAASAPGEESFRDPRPSEDDDPATLGARLVAGAEELAHALRTAGPAAPVPAPVANGTATFVARRMSHETAIHRADATLALGLDYALDEELAVDAVDEWMELGSLPMHFQIHPWMRELPGPGRTLHFHATDTDPEVAAEWLVDLTGDAIAWRRAHEKAAVAVRGPLTELLLLIYKQRPAHRAGVEILGDADLLDFWLERVSFG